MWRLIVLPDFMKFLEKCSFTLQCSLGDLCMWWRQTDTVQVQEGVTSTMHAQVKKNGFIRIIPHWYAKCISWLFLGAFMCVHSQFIPIKSNYLPLIPIRFCLFLWRMSHFENSGNLATLYKNRNVRAPKTLFKGKT